MNIFVTNESASIAAREQCDVLLRKMIVESCQLLSTAHIVLDKTQVAMKSTHVNHPSAVWVRESEDNYHWLFHHFCALLYEYTKRFGKVHKSGEHILALALAPMNIPRGRRTDFVFCGPDKYMIEAGFDVVTAYRLYIKNKYFEWTTRCDKRQMKVEYTNTNKPDWL